jgi:PAS domain S-box-containing protein
MTGTGPAKGNPTDATRRVRLIWRTDAAGRLSFDNVPAELVSLTETLSGQAWPKRDELGRALDAEETFVGCPAEVTLAPGIEAKALFSATPLTTTGGAFDGFRGFAVVTLPTAIPRPATVPERPARAPAPPSDDHSGLTEIERQAFRDIARALGARPSAPAATSEAITPAETETAPPTLTVAHAASLPAEFGLARTILDRLPRGILVSRGDVPVLMNKTLCDWLGYADIDSFHALGGLDQLFGGRNPQRHAPDGDGAMLIRREDGTLIALSVTLQRIVWDDLPASLMLFEKPAEESFLPQASNDDEMELAAGVSASEWRGILDTALDGVVVLDHDGRIVTLNRPAEALFGCSSERVQGERFVTLFSDDTAARALDYFEGLKDNGVASILNDGREVIGLTETGGRIPLYMTMGRIGSDAHPKFCAVLSDITQFKRAERDFTEARRAAELASARKSDFIARISHEIRTPLSAMIGFAEVMREERFGALGNPRYRDYVGDILKSGELVLDLINDLLDLSKIEAGRADLDFREVAIPAILSEALGMVQESAHRGRVFVRVSTPQHLPHIVADPRALKQILINLLSNAIKFTPEGGQVILSTALTPSGEVAIRIKDTGIGMSDSEITTALEPFRQVATTRSTGGTGLGLPLTKALVEANRATMAIKSARGTGTLVEITFPPTRVLADR